MAIHFFEQINRTSRGQNFVKMKSQGTTHAGRINPYDVNDVEYGPYGFVTEKALLILAEACTPMYRFNTGNNRFVECSVIIAPGFCVYGESA